MSRAVFKAITPGPLAPGAFQIGQFAQTPQAHMLFDPKSGTLLYDPDGSGAAAAQVFAVLPAGVQLTKADFLVV